VVRGKNAVLRVKYLTKIIVTEEHRRYPWEKVLRMSFLGEIILWPRDVAKVVAKVASFIQSLKLFTFLFIASDVIVHSVYWKLAAFWTSCQLPAWEQ
jgi:hypothetical protein